MDTLQTLLMIALLFICASIAIQLRDIRISLLNDHTLTPGIPLNIGDGIPGGRVGSGTGSTKSPPRRKLTPDQEFIELVRMVLDERSKTSLEKVAQFNEDDLTG